MARPTTRVQSRRTRWLSITLVFVGVALTAPAAAQADHNDQRSVAQAGDADLWYGFRDGFDNTGFGEEPGEFLTPTAPDVCDGRDMVGTGWFRLIGSGRPVTVFTGGGVDTVLGLYASDPFTPWFDCNDDISSENVSSQVSFDSERGARYFVQVGGCSGGGCGTNRGDIDVTATTPAPANDARAAAESVSSGTFIERENFGATMEPGQEATDCGGAPVDSTVWFKFSTGTRGDVIFTATELDSVLALYAGGSATPLDCSDDTPDAGLAARVARRVEPGDYFIQVGGFAGEQGNFKFQAQFQPLDDDRDGVSPPQDCNDGNPAIRPGVAELVANDVDENCDGVREYDRDGDGARVPGGDCDDNDARRRPGAREIRGNKVDENCDGVAARRRVIPGSLISASWQPGAEFTIMRRLTIREVQRRSKVTLRCRGDGCPFRVKSRPVRRAARKLAAHKLLSARQKRLRPGIVLEVRITKAGFRGKVRVYKMRRNAAPNFIDRCLEGGSRRRCAGGS